VNKTIYEEGAMNSESMGGYARAALLPFLIVMLISTFGVGAAAA
jgi:hypothetical protein